MQSVVGPDGGEHLLIMTQTNLFNKVLLDHPANRDLDQLTEVISATISSSVSTRGGDTCQTWLLLPAAGHCLHTQHTLTNES